MRKPTGLLLALLLSAPALAWVPKLDDSTAKVVLDSAYNRATNPTPTLLTVDLSVKDGRFGTGGDGAVTVVQTTSTSQTSGDTTTTTTQSTVQSQPANSIQAIEGGEACISNWLKNPTDYNTYGSRPISITFTGQADALFLKAQQARDAFKNLSVKDALTPDKNALPDGDLKVYVQMAGLASDKQRDAYDVALQTADQKIVRPYKRAYTNDWKQGDGGKWAGTMVYYFNALKNGVQPGGKVNVLIRTEADTDCAYSVAADLSKFN